MPKMIFVNLPVADLKKSMDFYAAIGFKDQDVVVLGKWIDGRPN